MKEYVKKHISGATRKRLRNIKKWMALSKKTGDPFIKRVWISSQMFLKDSIKVQEKLDYPKNIQMEVHSCSGLPRLFACGKEPETVAWIETFAPSDIFYDIGACVGGYSLLAATLMEKGQVYAFEPRAASFRALQSNIALNALENKIFPLPVGLGEKNGLETVQPKDPSPSLVYRLDDLVEHLRLSFPNHIKIDVDRNEHDIINGAKKTLTSPAVRSLLVEVSGSNSEEIRESLAKKGFFVAETHNRGRLNNFIFKRKKS